MRGAWLSIPIIVMALRSEADACMCVKPRSQERAIAESDVAFEGVVISAVRRQDMHFVATMVVKVAFKGTSKDAVVAVDGGLAGGGQCGVFFETKKRYVVYATRGPKGLETDRCSGTEER